METRHLYWILTGPSFAVHTANEGPVRIQSKCLGFPIMYSQKWNCAASLFSKQNYNVLSLNSYIHVSVIDLYIPRISLSIFAAAKSVDRSWKYINRSQTHECRNWDWGLAVQCIKSSPVEDLYRSIMIVSIGPALNTLWTLCNPFRVS